MIMEFRPQVIKDSTIELCNEDPFIADIFATANPEDFLEELLHLCMRRGVMIHKAGDILTGQKITI